VPWASQELRSTRLFREWHRLQDENNFRGVALSAIWTSSPQSRTEEF